MATLNDLLSFLQGASNSAAATVSAPVDGINWLLKKAGVPVSDKPVGGSDWLNDKGLMAEPQNPLAGYIGEAVGGVAPMLTGAYAPQIAKGINQMAANAATPAVLRKESGMFIGPSAKTWNAEAAKKAQTLAAKGVDPRQIWKETGTFKGPDGAWRQEIDDSAAKLRDYQYTPQEAYKNAKETAWINEDTALAGRVKQMQPYVGMSKNQLKEEYRRTGGEIVDAAVAGDKAKALQLTEGRAGLDYLLGQMSDRKYGPASAYLSHGDFGKAYPDVYKLHTRIDGDADSLGAYLRADTGRGEQMVLKKKPMWSEDKSTMLHEFQHAIQQREGWARGGSMDDFYRQSMSERQGAWDQISAINAELSKASGTPRYQELLAERQKLVELAQKDPLDIKEQAYKSYRSLAGEAEARATQARMNLNAAQRRELFPLDSYDVPVDQLIIRGLLD